MELHEKILNFWYGGLGDSQKLDGSRDPARKWFKKDPAFDRAITEQFGAVYEQARQGGCRDWEDCKTGRMALIILLDQFPRNMFRDSPRMFATDGQAAALARTTVQEQQDQDYAFVHRVFLYMPFMHSEELETQELGVVKFGELAEDAAARNPWNKPYFEYNLTFAIQHRDIIKRFGRFPHRNAILGRESTPEEERFLSRPGSSF